MRVRNLFCTLVLLAMTTAASAQSGFGIVGGVNINKLRAEAGSMDAKAGFHIGVLKDCEIVGPLHIQTSLLFTQKGTKESYVDKTDKLVSEKVDNTITLNYLQVPIELSIRIPVALVSLDLNAGPYFSMGLVGKVKHSSTVSVNGVSTTTEYETKNGFKDDGDAKALYKRFDTGLRFGVGTHLLDHLGVGLYYDLGFTKLNKEDVSSKFAEKNGTFMISASLTF